MSLNGQETATVEAASAGAATYVVGDVHGRRERLEALLSAAGLVGNRLEWTGGKASLWFMGDFFDRGPDGVGTVELAMRLEREASDAGGFVGALLGNHEPLILAALKFSDLPCGGPGGSFLQDWRLNGGQARDLERLEPRHVAWLERRPAMARVGGALLAHADARFYEGYGDSLEAVNAALHAILTCEDPAAWDRLLEAFSERDAFLSLDGPARAAAFLSRFGGSRLVHGHTPIHRVTGRRPEEVREPFVYANGLCVNLDGGLASPAAPGFVWRLEEGP